MLKNDMKVLATVLTLNLASCVASMDQVNRAVGKHQPISYRG